MVINFCDPVLKPRISCNAVTIDGYDVTNLCSLNPSLRNKGLLVESYIRPPVSIIVHLPVNIDISHIVICTSVGAQRSCALEVYSHSQQRTSSWLMDYECRESSHARVSFPSDNDINRVYSCIGRAQDDQAQYFNFVNSSYRADVRTDDLPDMPKHSLFGNIKTSELHSKYHRYLNNVSHIVIRITRAIRSSACALRWLEIWGQPSHACKASWHRAVRELCWQEYGSRVEQDSACAGTESNERSNVNDAKTCEELEELPEEFIDPLTQEMMLMPVLLPCGKTIDQTSLDHYVKQLAHWGHAPNDPYTGKEFTENEKPIPNAALKARMDQFLLRHPNIASKVDFRVGRNGGLLAMPRVTHSNLLSQACTNSEVPSSSTDDHQDVCRPAKRLRLDASKQNRAERTFTAVSHSVGSAKLSKNGVISSDISGVKTRSPSAHRPSHLTSNTLSTHPITTTTSSHPVSRIPATDTTNNSHIGSATTSSDLDQVLQLTLARLPSFLQKSSSQNDNKKPECVYCEKCVDVSYLYMLECSHLLCKQCLVQKQDRLECARCGQITCRTDVIKAHL